jgi:hypothetical protein
MNPPCRVVPGLADVLVTTGNRQEKSTLVTGRSVRAMGVVAGLGAAGVDVADGDRLGLGLALAADGDELHAASTKARSASVRLT